MKQALLAAALALALAACATSGTTAPRTTAAIPSGLPLGCVVSEKQRCDRFGTYYSGDDLRKTGAQHVGQALTMVDPELGH